MVGVCPEVIVTPLPAFNPYSTFEAVKVPVPRSRLLLLRLMLESKTALPLTVSAPSMLTSLENWVLSLKKLGTLTLKMK